ncbi:organomercurial lyase, partial [Streptomyces sp. NPDC059411]|uniref:organomercurial lyase n=1 Tax=Streptomyces sp. NPDC059411 TaxID=3346825 RepID=UPI003685CFE4
PAPHPRSPQRHPPPPRTGAGARARRRRARRPRPGGGPAASACCDALNFFTDTANAHAWTSQHPDVPGQVVDQPTAEHIGRQTFGPLLAP